MAGVRPQSNRADSGLNPSDRHPLQLDQPAPHDLEGPMQPSSDRFISVFSPTRPLGSALLDLPREHIVIEPGSISPSSVRDSEVLESASPSGRPWMNAPAGLIPGLHLSSSSFQGPVPDCWSPSDSPSAESYDPWSNWSLKGSMLEPLPGSPLQPLPPSPPSSAQEERSLSPVRPTGPPCKARRRLF
ncbi:proline-rich protein 23B-like [Rattus rattus]|uniref:proline-rich protein 23B-like n=1 Tax=Rattus rattus TaxID=10117 RepID=UPI0013F36936|nr:proline-rich protein 23B-like [Rattus rattus]